MERQLEQLAELFLRFPGIGRRQAARLAYFILTQPEGYVQNLAATLLDARAHAHTCDRCMRIFEGDGTRCSICSDSMRDQSTIIVVEKSQDIDSFHKTDYRGLFFVLNGLIPIVQKAAVANTNAQSLVTRAQSDAVLSEIILAFPLTPNGEHTDIAIREMLASNDKSLSSLGRGLSTGAELEYADAASLNASLKKRE